ncbi:MAG: glycosyltransferase family 2 protein [Bacteriovoracia bacterium]
MEHLEFKNIVIVIPSFCPSDKLIQLVKSLKEKKLTPIVVVNDGSPASYDPIFEEAKSSGCLIIHSHQNMGKGDALKKGIKFILEQVNSASHILCCDDDGQHSPQDILKVAQYAINHKCPFILGVRNFDLHTPFKSLIGNLIVNRLLSLMLLTRITDSQTGLRCYDRNIATNLLHIKGNRFSFETSSLIHLLRSNLKPIEISISTIYFSNNQDTRFKIWRDSYQILKTLLVSSTLKSGEK